MPTKFWYAAGALSFIGIVSVVLVAIGGWSYKKNPASAIQNDDFSLPSNDPPLAGNAALQTDRAVQVVLRGKERGPAWNGQMPAFAEQLENHEIAAVITWARQQWGNTGAVVTPNDVARLRQ